MYTEKFTKNILFFISNKSSAKITHNNCPTQSQIHILACALAHLHNILRFIKQVYCKHYLIIFFYKRYKGSKEVLLLFWFLINSFLFEAIFFLVSLVYTLEQDLYMLINLFILFSYAPLNSNYLCQWHTSLVV
jgi:hypothetical protein